MSSSECPILQNRTHKVPAHALACPILENRTTVGKRSVSVCLILENRTCRMPACASECPILENRTGEDGAMCPLRFLGWDYGYQCDYRDCRHCCDCSAVAAWWLVVRQVAQESRRQVR
ncbi:hypothetical protein GBB04_04660 [Bifidobacterium dentium]|uniref:Uncharacterized protein n=1 Tax=Bifidobacterium dentium TaxID=1689 RepID=A0A7J5TIN5_9BIFI|nr:hypothetical protein GBB04_04660 [Bifidobacterium dentium]KAB7463826.1 hypothetical protein GBB12_08535 [Bifidobacterium dentium]NEG39673.1 hypothetical protein [Bifidobacterium dentium]